MKHLTPHPPMITLTGQTNELQGQTFQARGDDLVIGRQQGCALLVNHGQVSRQHARVVLMGNQWFVEDLNSANGTAVNGQRISGRHPLRSGDRLALGSYEFSVQISGGSADDMTPTVHTPVGAPVPPPPQPSTQAPLPAPPYAAAPAPAQPSTQAPLPAPPYAAAPAPAAPQAQQRSLLLPCLMITLGVCMLFVVTAVAIGMLFYTAPDDHVADTAGAPSNQGAAQGVGFNYDVNAQGVVQVTSQMGGLVTTATGGHLLIPPGVVAPQADGSAGTASFSMQETSDRTPNLPDGFTPLGSVYQLGPNDTMFHAPVMLNLPIPADVDAEEVLGVAFYDQANDTWQMLPAAIDGTNRVVSVATMRFSPWVIFGFMGSASAAQEWRNNNGGILRVSNQHTYNSGRYPPPSGNGPYTVTYGVCIEGYDLADRTQMWQWAPSASWNMMIGDYVHPQSDAYWQTRHFDWWLPNGTYHLIEVWHFSEVNRSTNYSPRFDSYWRRLGPVEMQAGSLMEYRYAEADLELDRYVAGRAPCLGGTFIPPPDNTLAHSTFAYDVHITLAWTMPVGLHLYVTAPDGTTIYHENPEDSNGGQWVMGEPPSRSSRATGDRQDPPPANLVCLADLLEEDLAPYVLAESVFWENDTAPSGTYSIGVNYYSGCGRHDSIPFTIHAAVRGEVQTFSGDARPGPPQEVGTLRVP
ncbi:FHA domain-containing protein [Candidatus Viridilinea mediisalina]|uniref:FHA domain-containing protein n=1 Tax=Candidatus Viridilinea mediisalina TaxID=2024553 RepID=A0A2A6RHF5_9CHLR|nr:FHA domain-containing protein [Candidatus Viridilinea mediisalina]PDW02554.1 hypothetical protein CJ255_13430 [Candidatus Viridilinea mediisalina]